MHILKRLAHPRMTIGQLLVLVAVYLAGTQNLSFWREVLVSLPPQHGLHEYLFVGLLFLLLNAALLILLTLFSARRIVKPALVFLLLLSAVCSYFMNAFGEVIDESMIVNVFQTDQREASELIGAGMLLHILLQGLVPAMLLLRVELLDRGLRRETLGRIALLALALVTLVGGIALGFKDVSLWARENRGVRVYVNPTYPIYSAALYLRDQIVGTEKIELKPIARDATRAARPVSARPLVVVLVVGETARAANFQLNGYARATNPELGAIAGVTSYSRVTSCGTATAVSVPCMFSRMDRQDFIRKKAGRQENLVDVLTRVGVDVLWLDNNSGCKGVCDRVPTTDLSDASSAGLCNHDGCYDEILLDGLDQRLAAAASGPDRLIVLHQKGSHGPSYYKRYPESFRRFGPDCRRDAVQTCSREEIVDAYDNSIVYTDHLLARVIGQLQQHADSIDAVMIYLSDHGESLGERGLYLHGMPYAVAPEEQKHVPFIVWFPARATADGGLKPHCIGKHRDRPYSHDNLFDTVLGLFAVQTQAYRPDDDMFRECRAAR